MRSSVLNLVKKAACAALLTATCSQAITLDELLLNSQNTANLAQTHSWTEK